MIWKQKAQEFFFKENPKYIRDLNEAFRIKDTSQKSGRGNERIEFSQFMRISTVFQSFLLKPNYFKKQSSLSSFLLTKGNNTGPNGPGVLSRLILCI